MILDAQLLLSDAQALTSTAASTNVINFGSDRNVGIGEELAVVVSLDVAADAANADETYVVAVEVDDNSGFSSAASLGSITIPRGTAAGTKYTFLIPKGLESEQYLRLNYTLGGTSPSVTVTSFLIPAKGVDAYVPYADAITIS